MVSIVNEMPANITTGPSQRRRRNSLDGEFEIETLRSGFGDDMVKTPLIGNSWLDAHNITHRWGHGNKLRSARQATVGHTKPALLVYNTAVYHNIREFIARILVATSSLMPLLSFPEPIGA